MLHLLQTLPASMHARIASHQHRVTVMRNRHVFGSCSEQFLSRFMTLLVEVAVMPGECVLKAGEICRELRFVQSGAVSSQDLRGNIIDVTTSEGTAPCVIGAASFLMGAPSQLESTHA